MSEYQVELEAQLQRFKNIAGAHAKLRIEQMDRILDLTKLVDSLKGDVRFHEHFDEEEKEMLEERNPDKLLALVIRRHLDDMDAGLEEYWRHVLEKL